ncbi:unnamed protein product [Urochloa decumbens]|uniref:DUF1618 domain-containing protein n=1 Tax=Urochloa decumbens TaxID=240449 RepID=A0ABC9B5J5_9POAL
MLSLVRLACACSPAGFRCRRSIGIRSIHLLTNCRPPSESSASEKDDPCWVLVDCRDCRRDDSLVPDAKTVAESRTSLGQHLRVSFGLALPPASSFLRYDFSANACNDKDDLINVVAAHGDSFLLWMKCEPKSKAMGSDHFIYRSGNEATARPPSLSLIPPRNIPTRHDEGMDIRDPYCRPLFYHDTSVLRRGDEELLLAQLEVMRGYSERRGMADLCVLRHSRDQWELKRSLPDLYLWELKRSLRSVHDQGDKVDQELDCWQGSIAIAVGDRYLCWVQSPIQLRLHHVALGPAAVRFVAIEPRCCCGGFGRSVCERSRNAFTVTTWTVNLSMDEPMTWVKDGVMDCEELWAQPGYQGIPRVPVEHPVVSLDDPYVICFKVVEHRNAWMIQVDMRRKELVSAVKCTTDPWKTYYYLPAKL